MLTVNELFRLAVDNAGNEVFNKWDVINIFPGMEGEDNIKKCLLHSFGQVGLAINEDVTEKTEANISGYNAAYGFMTSFRDLVVLASDPQASAEIKAKYPAFAELDNDTKREYRLKQFAYAIYNARGGTLVWPNKEGSAVYLYQQWVYAVFEGDVELRIEVPGGGGSIVTSEALPPTTDGFSEAMERIGITGTSYLNLPAELVDAWMQYEFKSVVGYNNGSQLRMIASNNIVNFAGYGDQERFLLIDELTDNGNARVFIVNSSGTLTTNKPFEYNNSSEGYYSGDFYTTGPIITNAERWRTSYNISDYLKPYITNGLDEFKEELSESETHSDLYNAIIGHGDFSPLIWRMTLRNRYLLLKDGDVIVTNEISENAKYAGPIEGGGYGFRFNIQTGDTTEYSDIIDMTDYFWWNNLQRNMDLSGITYKRKDTIPEGTVPGIVTLNGSDLIVSTDEFSLPNWVNNAIFSSATQTVTDISGTPINVPSGYDGAAIIAQQTVAKDQNCNGKGLYRIHELTPSEAIRFSQDLWSDDAISVIKKLFADPMDGLVSFQAFPFSPSEFDGKELDNVAIRLGNYTSSVASKTLKHFTNINAGGWTISAATGFESYNPVTSYILYAPFIGFIDLPTDQITKVGEDTTLSLKYTVDNMTGTCMLKVYKKAKSDTNTHLVLQRPGKISMSIPLSARDFNQFIGGAAGSVVSLASGNYAQGVSQAGSALTKFMGDVNTAGTAGPNVGWLSEMRPCLIKVKMQSVTPELKDIEGMVTYRNSTINKINKKGFIRFEAVHLDGLKALKEEKQMIEQLLKEGVHVK